MSDKATFNHASLQGHRTALWAAAAMAIVTLAAAAPHLAPYDPSEQVDPVAGRHRPPGTVLQLVELTDGGRLLADLIERRSGRLLLHRRGELLVVPEGLVSNLSEAGVSGRRRYLLGTDRFGRDLLSRILLGSRASLSVGLLAALLSLSLGLTVGSLAAGSPPIVDGLLMRLVDGFLAFPRLFLILALCAVAAPSLGLVILVLGATGWMDGARLARGELLGLRRRPWVAAARATGAHPLGLFLRHLLPGTVRPVLVDTTLRIGDLILLEAALSYLGLGIQPPAPSWGNLIAEGGDALGAAWWVVLFPGCALVLTVLVFNFLGDAFNERMRAGRALREDFRGAGGSTPPPSRGPTSTGPEPLVPRPGR